MQTRLHSSKAPGQHGVHPGILYQASRERCSTSWALLFALVAPSPKALQAEVVLASGRNRPVTQLQADATVQIFEIFRFSFLYSENSFECCSTPVVFATWEQSAHLPVLPVLILIGRI
jgi:hypothetical protein